MQNYRCFTSARTVVQQSLTSKTRTEHLRVLGVPGDEPFNVLGRLSRGLGGGGRKAWCLSVNQLVTVRSTSSTASIESSKHLCGYGLYLRI